jgi:hypothetical protein
LSIWLLLEAVGAVVIFMLIREGQAAAVLEVCLLGMQQLHQELLTQ